MNDTPTQDSALARVRNLSDRERMLLLGYLCGRDAALLTTALDRMDSQVLPHIRGPYSEHVPLASIRGVPHFGDGEKAISSAAGWDTSACQECGSREGTVVDGWHKECKAYRDGVDKRDATTVGSVTGVLAAAETAGRQLAAVVDPAYVNTGLHKSPAAALQAEVDATADAARKDGQG